MNHATKIESLAQPRAALRQDIDDEIDLGQLFSLLWSSKWTIIFSCILGGSVGLFFAQSTTPVYRSDALLQVESKSSGFSISQDMSELFAPESSVVTEIEILKSRMMLNQVVDFLELTTVAQPKRFPLIGERIATLGLNPPKWEWLSRYHWQTAELQIEEFSVAQANVGAAFVLEFSTNSNFLVTTPAGSQFNGTVGRLLQNPEFTLRVSGVDGPYDGGFILKSISSRTAVENLKSSLSVSERGKSSGMLELSYSSIDQAHSVAILNALSSFYAAQNVERNAAEIQNSLDYLDRQLPKSLEKLSISEDKLNEYRSAQESVNLSAETLSVLEQVIDIEAQVSALELREIELSQKFTAKHPTYAALIKQKEKLLLTRRELESSTAELPETQQEVLRLSRDVEVEQTIYIQLLNRRQELEVLKAGTVGNVRIIDNAQANPKATSPKKPLIIAIAFVLAGVLAVLWIFLRAAIKRGIQNAHEIEKHGLSVYAVIPKSIEQVKIQHSIDHKQNGRILATEVSENIALESIKSLRTSLQFGLLDADQNVIAISGPAPGLGKSFLSLNLAVVLAQAGKKVLLIEADLRRGKLNQALNFSRKTAGLSELLSGRCGLSDVLSKTSVENLSYIARGKNPPNPSELLLRAEFAQLIADSKQMFDYVIIDTPPALAVTDAGIIGRYAGMMLLVAKHLSTTTAELLACQAQLEKAGVDVSGVILNEFDASKDPLNNNSYGTYGSYNYMYKSTN